ncbi:MAG: hypothetical protein Q7J24_00895 [Desulfomicrobium sp.]|nr:hypothetical protein [Desulfomicrobium sp.]
MRKSIFCFLIIIGAILFLNFQVHADSCFKMVDLESRADGSFFAYSINANGQVAGAYWCAGQTQAALWEPASGMRNLGALPGSIGSNAYGINTIGQIVGGCRTDDGNRAFIWDPVNGMQDLGNFPGATHNIAYDINSFGQVVGSSGTPTEKRAFLWGPAVDQHPYEAKTSAP